MTGKRSLIIAKTLAEAKEHALAYGLRDWQFVMSAENLIGVDPTTHALEFVGAWYERADLKRLRQRICGRGFNVPHLRQTPHFRTRFLSQDRTSDGTDDDT